MKSFLIALVVLCASAGIAEACGPVSRIVGRVQERRAERRLGVLSVASVFRSATSSSFRSTQSFVPVAPPVVKSPCPPGGCPLPRK